MAIWKTADFKTTDETGRINTCQYCDAIPKEWRETRAELYAEAAWLALDEQDRPAASQLIRDALGEIRKMRKTHK